MRSKLHLLRAALSISEFDVVLLQETLVRAGQEIKLKGYNTFYLPAAPGVSRGCAILVKDLLPCKRVDRPVSCGEGVEVMAVTLSLPRTDITLYNVYRSRQVELEFLELLATAAGAPVFVGGDFNAYHERWGDHRRNPAGRHIVDALDEVPGVALLNTGEATHVAGGALDLSFTSRPLAGDATWALHPHLASDHFALHISIPVLLPLPPPPTSRWNLHRIDWAVFRSAVRRHLSRADDSVEDIEEVDRHLVEVFNLAARESLPPPGRARPRHRDRWYYNDDVKEANHRVNMARRNNRRCNTEATRTLLRSAIRLARETANRAREECWLRWCSSLGSETTTAELWRKLKSVARGATSRPPLHPRPQEEAQTLITSFASRSASARLPPRTLAAQRTAQPARMALWRQACGTPKATDVPFTTRELEEAIPRRNTAPGEDGIPYPFLRQAGPEMSQALLRLYNRSYVLGALPARWKTATIVPIPKRGGASQLRPISLLSCVGKTMEKIVLNRLHWALGPWHENVFAFQKGKGTRDCVSSLLSGVMGRQAVAVFLDLEKAFEIASATTILAILAEKGVGGRLLRWIGDYLEGRQAAVRFQGHTSRTLHLENGTPQGGILSPVLFNVLVEQLTKLAAGPHARILCYADDVAMVVTGPNRMTRARALLRSVTRACETMGLIINRDKTKAVAFRYRRLPNPFLIDDRPIPWCREITYLGVRLDSRLTFAPYVTALKERVRTRTHVMRALTRVEGGASDRVLRLFYVQAVRSCVDYAAPCLMTLPAEALQPLEVAQHAALRLVASAPVWTKCVCLRAEVGICSVATRMRQLATSHLATLLRRAEAGPLRRSVVQALHQDPLLFHRGLWSQVAADVIRATNMSSVFLAPPDLPHPEYLTPPPWSDAPFSSTITPLSQPKATYTKRALATAAAERIRDAEIPGAAVYYTDGSVETQSGTVGAAWVTASATAIFRLSDGCSSTQAELVAILQALKHAALSGGGPVHIFCDSRPAIQSLSLNPATDNVYLLTSIHATMATLQTAGRAITVTWVPSHSDVPGNDAADRAAKEATLLPAPTYRVPPSLSLLKTKLAAFARNSTQAEVLAEYHAGSGSAFWYHEATNACRRKIPSALPRRTTARLHRLRLGYRCTNLLAPDDPPPVDCTHCPREPQYPLLHYLLECPATRLLLPNNDGLSAPALLNSLTDDQLIDLVTRFVPPR